MCQERVGIALTGLTMEIYMSREGWDHISRFNHGYLYTKKVGITLKGLTVELYMS